MNPLLPAAPAAAVLLIALAAPAPATRFVDVEEWDVTLDATCKGSVAQPMGDANVTNTLMHDYKARAHLETLHTALPAMRETRGAAIGTATIDEATTVTDENATAEVTWTASGALPSSAALVLEIEVDPESGTGTYDLQLDGAQIDTVSVMRVQSTGFSSTERDTVTMNGDFIVSASLPATGLVLQGMTELPGQCIGTYVRAPLKVTWKATPRDEPLKAIVNAPAVERGTRATLDGSASTGDPTRWSWEITPKPCPSVALPGENPWTGPTAPPLKMEGRSVSFPLLCDVEVILEVAKDGETDRSDPVVVKAAPRASWKTKVAAPVVSTFGAALTGASGGGGTCVEFTGEFGRNVCAIDEAALPQNTAARHWIHRNRSAGQFASHSEGVVIDTVTEGPFKGLHYAARHDLRIARAQQLHEDLAEGGAVAALNKTAAMRTLQKHTREHEALHTTLAMKAFRASPDPLTLVEQLVGDSADALIANTNGAIFAAEQAMADASTEGEVAKALGPRPTSSTIQFPACTLSITDWSKIGN